MAAAPEILLIHQGHPWWERTIAYARDCPWRAGPHLAGRMRANDFQDWERVIIAVDHGQIAGFCTLSEKDELPEAYGFAPFIGFVFVDERCRGRRLSERMIDAALRYAGEIGYRTVYLMSSERGLYEKYGFEKLGDYSTIFGTTDQLFQKSTVGKER